MTELWCCHVTGPDDVIAARDWTDAAKIAHQVNAGFLAILAAQPLREFDPHIWAAPKSWPGGSKSHTDDLKWPSVDYVNAINEARK